MKKTFYYNGTFFGGLFCIYLLLMFFMISSKNENITAFAIFGAIIPLLSGIGSLVWLIKFFAYISEKKVTINQYKLPLVFTGISMVFTIGSVLIFI